MSPKNTIVSEAKEKGLLKWQEEWTNTINGAVTKYFFPSVQRRLRLVIPTTAEFTSMVTGHGNTIARTVLEDIRGGARRGLLR
jgi:hypothetical protein